MVNPLENLVWDGALVGDNSALAEETSGRYAECPFKGWRYVSKIPEISHHIRVCLHLDQVEKQEIWDTALQKLIDLPLAEDAKAWEEGQKWWAEFWNRSRLVINSGRGEDDTGWWIGRKETTCLGQYVWLYNRQQRL